ncbi:hypothetical protein [Enterobacter cloacae]|uniref:hypothetical protein n=1 Tax=Enterobacter cloacae TaxID=550 RepID=UPI0028756158|nr:hypothetical protein [Enterobacter cloacae]MDR9913250.1 hypothetical protein [Enterobacter cloacae subsp. cloacae]
MKTVEILARHLNSWPADTTGIFMSPDTGAFYGFRVGYEHAQSIHTECLSGIRPADDAGVVVKEVEFLEQKSKRPSIPLASIINQPSDEQLRKENLYHTKLQCLAEVLGKQSFIDKNSANSAAEAINAAFDKITF